MIEWREEKLEKTLLKLVAIAEIIFDELDIDTEGTSVGVIIKPDNEEVVTLNLADVLAEAKELVNHD